MKGEETQMTKQGLVLVFNLVFGVWQIMQHQGKNEEQLNFYISLVRNI